MKHVTGAQLAAILGISRATVSNLAADGILVRADRGAFDLAGSVQAYVRHKVTAAKASGDDGAVQSLTAERARMARLKADQVEREARIAAGEYVAVADVEAGWLKVVGIVRSRLLAVPTKLAARIVGVRTPAEAEALLRKEIHGALGDIATTLAI